MKVRTKLIGTVVLGATLLVPVAQAQRPDDQAGPRGPGAIAEETFVQGVTDFPGSSKLAPQVNGVAVRGEVKDGVGTAPSTVVIVGDDKRDIGARHTAGVLVGDDKQGLPQNNPYAYWPIVNTADHAQYSQFAYRRALPQDLGPRAAVLAELDAKRREYVASAAVASEPVQVVGNPSNGFDWGDAGIGGLAGAGAALLLTGCVFFLMNQRHRVRTT
jgi:hypothetical protein